MRKKTLTEDETSTISRELSDPSKYEPQTHSPEKKGKTLEK